MRNLLVIAAVAAFSAGALAQDKITLTNGDVITGKIKSMAAGKVTIHSPVLKDVVVPIADVSDMVTGEPVMLKTKSGDLWSRRIVGIENESLRLEGGDVTELPVDNLGMINPPSKKQPKWTGSLKFTALYTDGNTRRESAGLLFDASRTTEEDRISVDAIWDYGKDKDVDRTSATFGQETLTQRRTGAGIKYDYFLSKRWYALATARALGDTLADLNLRFTAGAGLGYTVIDDDTTLLLTEFGLSYYTEDYRTPGLASQDSMALRVAYRFTHQLSEQTKFSHRLEAFPSLEDMDDFYLQAVTEISTSLTDSMIASVAHTIDYDNTPAAGRERSDNRVLLTVGWSF
jgi:putative salt-induced outer membrane protein YdiY